MKQGFDKRIFTAGIPAKDIGFLFYKLPKIVALLDNKKISKALIEKIMTVVTAVNGCTYCAWFHAKQAVSSGVS